MGCGCTSGCESPGRGGDLRSVCHCSRAVCHTHGQSSGVCRGRPWLLGAGLALRDAPSSRWGGVLRHRGRGVRSRLDAHHPRPGGGRKDAPRFAAARARRLTRSLLDSDPMRPLRYSINVTLDGCCDHRVMIPDEDLHRHAAENIAQADALLFGRVTYQMMEAGWRPSVRTVTMPEW